MAVEAKLRNSSRIIASDEALLSDAVDIFSSVKQQISHTNQLGRGTAIFFRHNDMELVLRHYRRGGLQRFIMRNQYLYTGLKNSRIWQEFQLLQELHEMSLPVPRPIAAQLRKTSLLSYTGSLITEAIPESQTLAQQLEQAGLNSSHWHNLGALIARFHSMGVCHGDLNANNILIDRQDKFYLIDFDKSKRYGNPGHWVKTNTDRLLRSLSKLQNLASSTFHFDSSDWQKFMSGYRAEP